MGAIEINKINKVLKTNLKYNQKKKIIVMPGQSKVHYSPGIPIRLNVKKPKPNEAFILIKKRKYLIKIFIIYLKIKILKKQQKNYIKH